MPRIAGKTGRRPAQHLPSVNIEVHRLRASATAPVAPNPPPEGDATTGFPESLLDMLGNNALGDCVAAATEHGRMLKAILTLDAIGEPVFVPGFRIPHTPYTEWLYHNYGKAMGEGPDADQGCVVSEWLLFLYKIGVIECFAESTNASDAQQKQDMLDWRGMLVGLTLTDQSQNEFTQGIPWGALSTTPDPQEGHGVWWCRYRPAGRTYISWAKYQDSTNLFDQACVDELWVVGTREDAERAGVNFDSLTEELTALANAHPVISKLDALDFQKTAFVDELMKAGEEFLASFEHEAMPFFKKVLSQITERELVGLALRELKLLTKV